MFMFYLLFIGLIAPWRDSCNKMNNNYMLVESVAEDDNFYTNGPTSLVRTIETREHNFKCVFYMLAPFQSDPSFIPIKTADPTVSGTESDDSSIRSVRFNKLAEVREMSPHEAMEALMSRLSYSASLRISRSKSHHKTARTALMFCILVRQF
jgi:solute carrier family 35, member F5